MAPERRAEGLLGGFFLLCQHVVAVKHKVQRACALKLCALREMPIVSKACRVQPVDRGGDSDLPERRGVSPGNRSGYFICVVIVGSAVQVISAAVFY
ncbi:hypothetical protein HCZ97_06725 [Pseudooceanicola sp. HF7]|nr:hypothetical protein [Pseudooceanicola sp. HF7]